MFRKEINVGLLRKRVDSILPNYSKLLIKRFYHALKRYNNKRIHINKKGYVEFGYFFRFTRKDPYVAKVGDGTISDRFNVWNANKGDIIVGNKCWFGLYNIIMGPVEIGDNFSSGPHVSILGPRHPTLSTKTDERRKTIIGENVIIATGAIVLFGVNIGDNSIIGPGSLVTKDVQPGSFVSGNPARDMTKMVGKLWKMDILSQERFR